jgi:hypothetical protein
MLSPEQKSKFDEERKEKEARKEYDRQIKIEEAVAKRKRDAEQMKKNTPGCIIIGGILFGLFIWIMISASNANQEKEFKISEANAVMNLSEIFILSKDKAYYVGNLQNNTDYLKQCQQNYPKQLDLIQPALLRLNKIDVFYLTGSRTVTTGADGKDIIIKDHSYRHVVKRSVYDKNPIKFQDKLKIIRN